MLACGEPSPRVRRRRPREQVGMHDLAKNLQAVHSPGSGAAEVGRAVHRIHLPALHRVEMRPRPRPTAGADLAERARQVEATGHQHHDLLPADSPRAHQVLAALNAATWKLAAGLSENEARAAREILRPELAKRGGDPCLNITAVGHAHIDLAWLWPLRETKRKGARTFALFKNLVRTHVTGPPVHSRRDVYHGRKVLRFTNHYGT